MGLPLSLFSILLIGIGAACGAVLRFSCVVLLSALSISSAWAIASINVIGSAALGTVIALIATKDIYHGPFHLFIAVGLLGAFTTFSTFSMDAVFMLERGRWVSFIIYTSLSVVGAMAAFAITYSLTKRFFA